MSPATFNQLLEVINLVSKDEPLSTWQYALLLDNADSLGYNFWIKEAFSLKVF
jgi:hypothetical protein